MSKSIQAAMRDLESIKRRAREIPMCLTITGATLEIQQTRELVHELAQTMQGILLGMSEASK